MKQLVRFFGPQAAEPVEFIDHDWSEDAWAGGCPVAGLPPGLLTATGHRLREPFGNVHWAGTETAEDFCGYMEGALEAGIRAAEEVLSRL